METQLVFRYVRKTADGSATVVTAPVELGYADGESNYLSEVEFAELHLEGTIEAWFEQINLMGMWLLLSSRGLRAAPGKGSYSIDPGPGKALVVKAVLRCQDDFENLFTGLAAHLTKVGEQFL